MTANQEAATESKSNTSSRISLFGPPPLLPGENSDAYDNLLAQVSGAVKPIDFIEEIWTRDIVDLTWEIFRWRQVKTKLVAANVPSILIDVLAPLFRHRIEYELSAYSGERVRTRVRPRSLYKLIQKWKLGDPAAISKVETLMVRAKLRMDTVTSQAFLNTDLEKIERINHLILVAEERRDTVLREIDRHRATFAQTLRDTVRDVEDAEFETIESKAIAPKSEANKNAA